MVVPLALGFSIKAPNVVQQAAKPAPPPTPPAPSASTASTRTLIRDIASRRSRASTVLMHRQRDRLTPGVGNFATGGGRDAAPSAPVNTPPGLGLPPDSGWVDQGPPSGGVPGPAYPPLAPPPSNWFQPPITDPQTGYVNGVSPDLINRVPVNNQSPWDVNYGVGVGGEVSFSPGGALSPAAVADLLNRHDEFDLSVTNIDEA